MMNGFILQENTSILISRNGKTLYSILHRSLDLTKIMKYNYSIIKYVGRIKHLIREHVFQFNIKAFTYIEALFALFVTTLILALLPTILKLTSFYLNTAQNNEDIQFEFLEEIYLKRK